MAVELLASSTRSVRAPLGYRIGYVLAAMDDTPVASAVEMVARRMTRYLDVPMRRVHASRSVGPGDVDRSRLARIEKGEVSTVDGRPSAVLTALIESPASPLGVMGMPSTRRSPERRIGGTTFSVARRVTRPLLVVPRELTVWSGPHDILVPLDGTATTAYAASLAIATLSLGAMTTTPVYVFNDGTVSHRGLRAGGEAPSGHLLDMTAEGAFDLVVVVWSQLAAGSEGEVVVDLLANCPVPVLLVPAAFGISKSAAALERGNEPV
jgi:hypothetical protein